MAQISVLAQPGLTFMQSADAARQNRLAMAAAEAERATAESQQRLRQQAFESLQGDTQSPANAQRAAQALAAGGDFEAARFISAEAERTANRSRQLAQDESAILANAAQSGADMEATRRRLERLNSPLARDEAALRETLEAYTRTTPETGFSIQRAYNPETGQNELMRINSRTGQVEPLNVRAPRSETADALAGIGSAIRAGNMQETSGGRDRSVRDVSSARQSASTTLQTAQQMIAAPEGAFGFRGNVTRDLTSVVEQMLGRGAAENVARAASGASLDELARIQVAAQIQVSQSIARITGEESGRISEAERELTTQVVGATQDLSTKSRAVQALAYLYPLEIAEVNRNMLLARGRLEYPFVNPDGSGNIDVLEQHVAGPMLAAGFNEADIRRAISSVMQITREQMGMHSMGVFADE